MRLPGLCDRQAPRTLENTTMLILEILRKSFNRAEAFYFVQIGEQRDKRAGDRQIRILLRFSANAKMAETPSAGFVKPERPVRQEPRMTFRFQTLQ